MNLQKTRKINLNIILNLVSTNVLTHFGYVSNIQIKTNPLKKLLSSLTRPLNLRKRFVFISN